MANTISMRQEYFDWICDLIDARDEPSYKKLLLCLDDIAFTYILAMDSNRLEDGIDLRYRFGYEMDYSKEMVKRYLDRRPCSVLEMMASLAIRCEETIMTDLEEGDRTGEWFWGMIDSLGLSDMTDEDFDEDYVEYVISKFLNRKYKFNGEGGLFTLRNPQRSMRDIEIWYQMMWYLNEYLGTK